MIYKASFYFVFIVFQFINWVISSDSVFYWLYDSAFLIPGRFARRKVDLQNYPLVK